MGKAPFKLLLCLMLSLVFIERAHAVPAEGHKMMIAAPSPFAVEVGKEIINLGGNVIDVAVAVGLTLAVTSPYYASLGGGGFALVKMGKEVEVLDFRETAPAATNPEYFLNKAADASMTGGAAVGVPGFPAGLWALHKKHGKLAWRQLFTIPTRLAQQGFGVSGEWARNTARAKDRFTKDGVKYFFKKDAPYRPGDILRQPNLAKALREFSRRNVEGFYQGAVAEDIVKSVNAAGGNMSIKDMNNYKVRWLKPLTTDYEGHKVYLMPPPSSGGVVIQSALSLIQQLELKKYRPLSVDELHLMGEILARSFRGRALLGDPDFHKNPLDMLLSKDYLAKMAASISLKESKKMEPLVEESAKESDHTTHYSIMDAQGNAISLTVTLNVDYGSGVVSSKYGIALNNEMDDFTTKPGQPNIFGLIQGKGNSVQAGKRPLSSMSPTLVEKDGKIVMALGAPGGPRIISGTLQTLYRVLTSKMDMDQAIQAPRVHHQFQPHTLFVDGVRLSPDVIDALKAREHDIKETWVARVNGVRMNEKGILEGAFDSRGEGAAGGF